MKEEFEHLADTRKETARDEGQQREKIKKLWMLQRKPLEWV